MDIEELPEEMRDDFFALKHGSYTIECDLKDALEEAENVAEFEAAVRSKMLALIGEAEGVIRTFCNDSAPVLTISLKGTFLPGDLEKIEDRICMLLSKRGIDATIEDSVTGNTTTTKDALIGLKADRLSVDIFEERDRLGIWVTDTGTDKVVFEVWDEDARQMFEDGFFVRGSQFKGSVIGYVIERLNNKKEVTNVNSTE